MDRHFRFHVQTTDRIIRALQSRGVIGSEDPAHFQILLSSPINVVIAQTAMWGRTYGRRFDGIVSLKQQVRLTLDLMFRAETI